MSAVLQHDAPVAPAAAGATRFPIVLGIDATTRSDATSGRALRLALDFASASSARTRVITLSELNLPVYGSVPVDQVTSAAPFLEAVRRCDGMIIAASGSHRGLPRLLTNALDYLGELGDDPAPFLHDRTVGCIVAADGWRAGGRGLIALQAKVRGLRGWPAPMGVIVDRGAAPFGSDGATVDPNLEAQLAILSGQVVSFTRRHAVAA
jgi:FMN reductase